MLVRKDCSFIGRLEQNRAFDPRGSALAQFGASTEGCYALFSFTTRLRRSNQMAENGRKIVYLIVEQGGDRKPFWKSAGLAYPCRDGSLNMKLDIHPGLTFNIRDPKSLGEQDETFTDEDDRNFPCDDCKTVTNNEEAHALSGGGAVCDACFNKKYKDCQACDMAFPKVVPGELCPECSR
jgi:hypothetical protein